jgi:hypothetical protein
LDDSDIIQLLKSWEKQSDQVLASLSSQLLHRKLPKIKIRDKAYSRDEINDKTSSLDEQPKPIYRLVNILFLVEAYRIKPIYPTNLSCLYSKRMAISFP